MSNQVKFYNGNEINLPSTYEQGAFYLTNDTGKMYYDNGSERHLIGQYLDKQTIGHNSVTSLHCSAIGEYNSVGLIKGYKIINKIVSSGDYYYTLEGYNANYVGLRTVLHPNNFPPKHSDEDYKDWPVDTNDSFGTIYKHIINSDETTFYHECGILEGYRSATQLNQIKLTENIDMDLTDTNIEYILCVPTRAHIGIVELFSDCVNSFVVGNLNKVGGSNSIVLGDNLNSVFDNQYVFGSGNIPSSDIIIVGNGSRNNHSNAFTLDRDGNAWFAGNITYGSSRTDIGAKLNELENRITAAFVAQSSAPSNTSLLWIDTTPTTGGLKYHNGTSWVTVPVRFA